MAAAEWSERTRLLVTVGVVVLINGAAWGFTYKARQDCETMRVKKEKLQADVKALDAEEVKAKTLEGDLYKLKNKNAKLEARLPNKPKRDELSGKISELTQRYKFTEKGIRYEYDKKAEVAGSFLCDTTRTQYEADFNSLLLFMNYFEEHYDYFIALDDLSIMARDSGMGVTDRAKHDVTLTIISYNYITKPTP
jgi:hypothetical protein